MRTPYSHHHKNNAEAGDSKYVAQCFCFCFLSFFFFAKRHSHLLSGY